MSRKYITVGYVPPPKLSGVSGEAFLKNIRSWDHSHDLMLYSDHGYEGVIETSSPERIKKMTTNRWAINNAVFLTGMRVAKRAGATHVIYLEADCRVGCDNWDKIMTDEFEKYEDAVVGGSMVCFGPYGYDRRWAKLFEEAVVINHGRKNFPIVAYNSGGCAEKVDPSVFVNGALGIYSFDVIDGAFGDVNKGGTVNLAIDKSAWDWEIGTWIFKTFKHDAFKKVAHLGCMYSSYGNVLTTEHERREMLEDPKTKYVAVHQIKSTWPGPLKDQEVDSKVDAGVPKTSIFIVSYYNDIEWLRYCVRSILKFASGFLEVIVCLPAHEKPKWNHVKWLDRVRIVWFDEVEGKGHLCHVHRKCCADQHVSHDTEFVLHMDSDCIFTEPVTPLDYFEEGKPVMLKERYEAMKDKQRWIWKEVTEKALGFNTPFETMCRHPSVYPVHLYADMRLHVESLHKTKFHDYVMLTQFPGHRSGFCEFNALGGFALKKFEEEFHWIDVKGGDRPHNKMRQFFSLAGMSNPDVMNNEVKSPNQIIKELEI